MEARPPDIRSADGGCQARGPWKRNLAMQPAGRPTGRVRSGLGVPHRHAPDRRLLTLDAMLLGGELGGSLGIAGLSFGCGDIRRVSGRSISCRLW